MNHTRLYLDNAATSFPKPVEVVEAMRVYATEIGASPGRGAYAESLEGAAILRKTREKLCELFGAESPEHVIFTLNCTDSLNLAIHGTVQAALERSAGKPVHVVTTAMDHNSVLRPLNDLARRGLVNWTCAQADEQGLVDPSDVRKAMTDETVLVAVCHASNVTGSVQDIAAVGEVIATHKAKSPKPMFLVDAAQSLGHLPVDVQAMGIDLLAFPGHKGLLGPLGTGGLWIRPGLEDRVAPVRQGGTGSKSEQDIQPIELPDRYEAGSHNTLGIVGLLAGVEWLLSRSVAKARAHEESLIETFFAHFPGCAAGYGLLGPRAIDQRVGVFAITHNSLSPAELAVALEAQGGVLARAGLHCAPRAHKSVGSFAKGGALRLSVGPFVSDEDIVRACACLGQIGSATLAS